MQIKKYTPDIVSCTDGTWAECVEEPDGDYVRNTDHLEVIDAIERAADARWAARVRLLDKALRVALGHLTPQQPGDSRAVDDWFVACAAVQCEIDDADGKIENCLDAALASLPQAAIITENPDDENGVSP